MAGILADFFGSKISCFWCVRKVLSVVLVFLLSSPCFNHAESYFQHGSFQKIRCEKFELVQGLTHGVKIHENSWKSQKFMIFTCESRFQQLRSDTFRNWPAQLKIWSSENPKFTKILAWNTLRWEMCKIWWACWRPTLGTLSVSVQAIPFTWLVETGF